MSCNPWYSQPTVADGPEFFEGAVCGDVEDSSHLASASDGERSPKQSRASRAALQLRSGEHVVYTAKNGAPTAAVVQSVHLNDSTPYITILVNSVEKQTEMSRVEPASRECVEGAAATAINAASRRFIARRAIAWLVPQWASKDYVAQKRSASEDEEMPPATSAQTTPQQQACEHAKNVRAQQINPGDS